MSLTDVQRKDAEKAITTIGSKLVTLDDIQGAFEDAMEKSVLHGREDVGKAAMRGIDIVESLIQEGLAHLVQFDSVLTDDENERSGQSETTEGDGESL